MPYSAITQGDKNNLKECKFAESDVNGSIKFSPFTSCIGVVAKIGGNKIYGVHLPISSGEATDTQFDSNAAEAVIELFEGKNYTPASNTAVMVGFTSLWSDKRADAAGPTVNNGYIKLQRYFMGPLADIQVGDVDAKDTKGSVSYIVDKDLEVTVEDR